MAVTSTVLFRNAYVWLSLPALLPPFLFWADLRGFERTCPDLGGSIYISSFKGLKPEKTFFCAEYRLGNVGSFGRTCPGLGGLRRTCPDLPGLRRRIIRMKFCLEILTYGCHIDNFVQKCLSGALSPPPSASLPGLGPT